MAKDPRYKSGEHHYGEPDEDSTKETLEALSTIGAVGAEIRSVRREMKSEFRHFGARFDDSLNSIRDLASALQAMSTEHAGNLVRIRSLEKRVGTVETTTRLAPAAAATEPETGWIKTLAKNPAIPWAVASLLALAMILAAITGRGVDGLIPHRAAQISPETAGTPAVNVNVKE